jgi:hypothetical protein
MFGDFIQQLSVVNEKFYETGRKGILYISDGHGGDFFRFGLSHTYNDTYPVIIAEKYIVDYQIYNPDIHSFEINLNQWRNNPDLFNKNWYQNYKETFSIEWGKHKWINVPIDTKFQDKVLINTTNYRWSDIDFSLLHSLYGDNMIYISADKSQYQHFCYMTSINIEYYQVNSFYDLCVAINSCKLFAGSQSAPLAIAHAVHVNRICSMCMSDRLNADLNEIWSNVRYKV